MTDQQKRHATAVKEEIAETKQRIHEQFIRYHGENRPGRHPHYAAMAYTLNLWRDRAMRFAANWQASPGLELAARRMLADWWPLVALPFEGTSRGVSRGAKAEGFLIALVRVVKQQ